MMQILEEFRFQGADISLKALLAFLETCNYVAGCEKTIDYLLKLGGFIHVFAPKYFNESDTLKREFKKKKSMF